MRLFIKNKTDMDLDLQYEAKQAHQGAFNELQQNLSSSNSIPKSLFFSIGRVDYFFSLISVDIERDIFVYFYNGSAVGG